MKANCKNWVLMIIAPLLIFCSFSCVTDKTYKSEEVKMRNESIPVFVEKTDGEKVQGSNIKHPSVWTVKNDWLTIDGQKIHTKDIDAYQSKSAYYKKFKNIFVAQLKRGKMNLYWYETRTENSYYDGTKRVTEHTSTQHFVFQKNLGELVEASMGQISEMLSDNPPVQKRFEEQFKPGRILLPKQLQNKPKKLFEIIDLYNNS